MTRCETRCEKTSCKNCKIMRAVEAQGAEEQKRLARELDRFLKVDPYRLAK